MMKHVLMVPLLLLALAFPACSPTEEPPPAAAKKSLFQEEPTGEALFDERCRQCHMVQQKGGVVGPDLSQVGKRRDRLFLEQVIREPSKLYPGTVMPPYDTFSRKQVDSLVDYLSGLR